MYMNCPESANAQRQKADQWFFFGGGSTRRAGAWGVTAHGDGVATGDDENVPKLGCGDGCTSLDVLKTTEWPLRKNGLQAL